MRMGVCFTLALMLAPLCAWAWETDDFRLPPRPLADLSAPIEQYVDRELGQAVQDTNDRIRFHLDCLARDAKHWSRDCYLGRATLVPALDRRRSIEGHQSKVAELRTPMGLVDQVYDRLGFGFPSSKIEKFLNHTDFSALGFVRYMPPFRDSIFADRHVVYLAASPTIRMHGVMFGTDKLGHLIQQGYTYYQIYAKARADGASEQVATHRAVEWGVMMEEGFFGLPMSGVFSNADLAANYLGLKWFRNLTEAVKIRGHIRPAIAVVGQDGFWALKSDRVQGPGWLKDFITLHYNEALNPSQFTLKLFEVVKQVVLARDCGEWQQSALFAQGLSSGGLEQPTIARDFRTIDGEDYGFTEVKGRMVGVLDDCPKFKPTRSVGSSFSHAKN